MTRHLRAAKVLGSTLRRSRTRGVLGLGVALALSALSPAATAVSLGLIIGNIDEADAAKDLSPVIAPLLLFGGVVLAGHAASSTSRWLTQVVAGEIDGCLRKELLGIVDSQPSIEQFESAEVQRLIRQAGAEPDHAIVTPGMGATGLLTWLAGLAGAVMACAVVAQYQLWPVPLLLGTALAALAVKTRHYYLAASALQGAMEEEMHADVWRNASASAAEGKEVRVFGFASWMIARMQAHVLAGNLPFWNHIAKVARQSWLVFVICMSGLVPVYIAVAIDGARGNVSLGLEASVLLAAWSVYAAIGSADQIYQVVAGADVVKAFQRLRSTLDRSRDRIAVSRGGVFGDEHPPRLRMHGISFRYPGSDDMVLQDLDLDVRPGELVALVGLNGAGKSTLVNVMTGLYRPLSGKVYLDNDSLGDFDAENWRRNFYVVFQDFNRYELSAADNVHLADPDGPFSLEAATTAAAASKFGQTLSRLPRKWDTPLSRTRSGGVDLSGGQWQQLAITRAIYARERGAKILIMDEPTAHLDVRTEQVVFDSLVNNRGGASLLLISHRLSTVRRADRILFLDEGRIIEEGTHEKLLSLRGRYAELFETQARPFRKRSETPQ